MKNPCQEFGTALLLWHRDIDRQMPWKETSDPYHIWISEIILQQTRVAQGRKYFEKFLEKFPSIRALAQASEDEVLSVWKGLGYYARARNLHTAAKTILNDHEGEFPTSYSEILGLKGIGPYSAAAIASFAYHMPYAVLDGNVFRVLSRVFAMDSPIDSSEGKKIFAQFAQLLLGEHHPAYYNQAIMDFGALICLPKSPQCQVCPLQRNCKAFTNKTTQTLPVKLKKLKIRKRYFHYFIVFNDHKILLKRRVTGDIWQGLYEPPMIETSGSGTPKELDQKASILLGKNITTTGMHKTQSAIQKLTHQTIQATFYHIERTPDEESLIWIPIDQLESVAMPKVVDDYLKGYIDSGTQTSLF